MTETAPRAPQRLLVLADEVGLVHAEVGDAVTHAWLAAAIEALAHALVDLSDGRSAASTRTLPRALPPDDTGLGRPSCAAAAATLRTVHTRVSDILTGPDGVPVGLAQDTMRALGVLADALQDLATAADEAHLQAVRPTAHRAVRRCHRLLQPGSTVGS